MVKLVRGGAYVQGCAVHRTTDGEGPGEKARGDRGRGEGGKARHRRVSVCTRSVGARQMQRDDVLHSRTGRDVDAPD